MTQQLSNCCKAQVSVSSSDEGTSCFMCDGCRRPCDLEKITALNHGNCSCPICVPVKYQLNKTMKEQVSVDNKHGEKCKCPFCVNFDWSLYDCNDDCNCPGCRSGITESICERDNRIRNVKVEMSAKEYQRLKRLDENVNRELKEIESILDDTDGLSNLSRDWFNYKLKLLKSLCDETTQES